MRTRKLIIIIFVFLIVPAVLSVRHENLDNSQQIGNEEAETINLESENDNLKKSEEKFEQIIEINKRQKKVVQKDLKLVEEIFRQGHLKESTKSLLEVKKSVDEEKPIFQHQENEDLGEKEAKKAESKAKKHNVFEEIFRAKEETKGKKIEEETSKENVEAKKVKEKKVKKPNVFDEVFNPKEEIEELKVEFDDDDEKAIKKNLDESNKQKEEITNKEIEAKKELDEKENEAKKLQDEVKKKEVEAEEKKDETIRKQDEIKKLEEKNLEEDVKRDIEDKEKVIQNLQNDAELVQEEVKKLKEEILDDEFKIKIEEKGKELENLQKEAELVLNEIEEIKEKHLETEVKKQIEDKEKELKKLQEEVDKKEDEVKELKVWELEKKKDIEEKKKVLKKFEQSIIIQTIKHKVLEKIKAASQKEEIKEKKPAVLAIDKSLLEKKEEQIIIDTKLDQEDIESILKDIDKKILTNEKVEKVLADLKKEKITIERINERLELIEEKIEDDLTFIEEQLENSKKRYNEAVKSLDIKKVASFHKTKDETGKIEDLTIITLTVTPEKTLFDVSIFEEIPKSIVSNVNEIIFYDSNYEVIEPDPLIVWNFAAIDSNIDISYGVKKIIDTELLKETKTVPITGKIIEKDQIERFSLFSIIFPAFMTFIIAYIVIFFHKFTVTRESNRLMMRNKEKELVDITLRRLTTYIENNVARGIDGNHIEYYLLKKGWPKVFVNAAFNRIRII